MRAVIRLTPHNAVMREDARHAVGTSQMLVELNCLLPNLIESPSLRLSSTGALEGISRCSSGLSDSRD